MSLRARTQPADLTLRAGATGHRVALANLRKNWPSAVTLVVIWGGYSYRNNDSWSQTLVNAGLVLGGVLGAVAVYNALYSRSTVVLTRDELVVTRMGRRQRLPRAEVGGLVRGSTSSLSMSSVPGFYWFITDTRDERFVALPGWLFPDGAFEDLSRELGIRPRAVTDREEEVRLSPLWMKNVLVTGVLSAVVLIGMVALVLQGAGAWQDWRQERAERAAESRHVAQVEPRLTASRYPHLKFSEHDVATSPLTVSASAEEPADVRLRSAIALVGTHRELPAAETMDLLALQCAPSEPGDEVSRASVTYESDDDLGYERVVDLECGADRKVVEEWLTWAEEHPATSAIGQLTLESTIGHDGELRREAQMWVPDASDDRFRAAVEYMCAHPGADEVDLRVNDEDFTRSLDVDCSDG